MNADLRAREGEMLMDRKEPVLDTSIYFCDPASLVDVSLLRVELTVQWAFLNFET
jgi:hypothetical protein